MWRTLTLLVILALAVRTAVAAPEPVTGTYALRDVMETASELSLRPDGRFEFALVYGAADYWSKGTWKREGDGLVLDTDVPNREPIRLLDTHITRREGVRITVQLPGGRTLPNVDIRLTSARGTTPARTDDQGVAYFRDAAQPMSVIVEVPVFDFTSKPVTLDPAANDFRLALDGEQISLLRFTHMRVTMDGHALVLQLPNARRPFRYVKAGAE